MAADINASEISPVQPIVGAIEVDVGNEFATNMVFEEREDLISWARKVARGLGFVLTISKSDSLTRRRPRVFLGCDRSGYYRVNQLSKIQIEKGVRHSFTKRIGCPFSLKGQKVAVGVDQWKVEVVCGIHNHKESTNLEGHTFAKRLNNEQKLIVKEMSQVGAKARECLLSIKKKDPENVSTLKTIYNVRAAMRREELGGKTPMHHLLKLLSDLGYITFHRMDEQSMHMTDLFFAHPTAIDLSNAFPNVFLFDCNYKMNRFQLPLLSIVGITSTSQTFCSAVAFISSKKEDSFIWALECFKSIFSTGTLPLVMVIDHDLALINALKSVFPLSKNILSIWHISNNVLTHCKKLFPSEERFQEFSSAWNALIRMSTEMDYHLALKKLESEYSDKPTVLSYVKDTWLNPFKEFFVSAWIDGYFHLGTSTTSQVESSHTQLKHHLLNSTSNLTTVLAQVDDLINGEHKEIKASFLESRIKRSEEYSDYFYSELCGQVSMFALEKIKEQRVLAQSAIENNINGDQDCQHVIRHTFGIPCGHELVHYIRNDEPLPLSKIHDHWKRLLLLDEALKNQLYEIDPEIEIFMTRYVNATVYQKVEMKRKLREIGDPTSTLMKEPLVPKQRGRPKGSFKKVSKESMTSTKQDLSGYEYVESKGHKIGTFNDPKGSKRSREHRLLSAHIINCLPKSVSPFIKEAKDVAKDGHCGFRVVADLMGMGEDGWRYVRGHLVEELENHTELYTNLFGSDQRVCELATTLKCWEVSASPQFWMTMPDMGHLISSRYEVVLVHISKEQCLTFLPLRSPFVSTHRLVAIGYINNNHFVQLDMIENTSIPPIAYNWWTYHDEVAAGWATPYISRMKSMADAVELETAAHHQVTLSGTASVLFHEEFDSILEGMSAEGKGQASHSKTASLILEENTEDEDSNPKEGIPLEEHDKRGESTPAVTPHHKKRKQMSVGNRIADALENPASVSKQLVQPVQTLTTNDSNFSYVRCLEELQKLDGLDEEEMVKAVDLLENEKSAIAFMTITGPRRLAWLRYKCNRSL